MTERLFTAYQVADILGRARHEVQAWIEAGELASQRLADGTVRISEKQLVRFLRARGIDMEAIMAETLKAEGQQACSDERAKLLAPQAAEPTGEPDLEETYQPVPPLAANQATPQMVMAAHVAAALDSEADAEEEGEGKSPVHPPDPSAAPAPTPADAPGHGPVVYASFTETVNGSAASTPGDGETPVAGGSHESDASPDVPAPEAPPSEPAGEGSAAQAEIPAAVEGPGARDEMQQVDAEPTDPAPDESPEPDAAPAEETPAAVVADEPTDIDADDHAASDEADDEADDEAPTDALPLPQADEQSAPAADEPQTDDDEEEELDEEELPAADTEAETSQAEQIARAILTDAVSRGATAIRLDARGADVTLRLRLNGALEERTNFRRRLPEGMGPKLIDEFKALAGLNGIASGPQRGRGEITVDGRTVELAVSGLPTVRGQEIVIRLADPAAAQKDLAATGMARKAAGAIERLLARPYGMIVVAAPPRHGLAETLGAMTARLADSRRGVLAIQRGSGPPVANTTQCRCGGRTGMEWGDALWAAEDHDCDVVAVEDVGDPACAAAAIESALAGRMVLAGMRAMSVVEAIRQLVRMGAKPWPLASSLIGVVTQRTVPTLCPHCRTPVRHAGDHLAALGLTGDDVDFETFGPAGCDRCNQTGYSGTALLAAVTHVTDALADAIRNGDDDEALNEIIADTDADSLLAAALRSVRKADLALTDLVAAGIV